MDLRQILNPRADGDVAESMILDRHPPTTTSKVPHPPPAEPSSTPDPMGTKGMTSMNTSHTLPPLGDSGYASPTSTKDYSRLPGSDMAADTNQSSNLWHWEHTAAERVGAFDAIVEKCWGHLPDASKKSLAQAEMNRLHALANKHQAFPQILDAIPLPLDAPGSPTIKGAGSPVPSVATSVSSLSSLNSIQMLEIDKAIAKIKGRSSSVTADTPGLSPSGNALAAYGLGAEPRESNALFPNSSELFKDFLNGIKNIVVPSAPRDFLSDYRKYNILTRNLVLQVTNRIRMNPLIPEFVTTPPVKSFGINFVSVAGDEDATSPYVMFLDKTAGVLVKNDSGVTKADVCNALENHLTAPWPPKVCPLSFDQGTMSKSEPMPAGLPLFVRSAVDQKGTLQALGYDGEGSPLWAGNPEIFVFCAPLSEDFVEKMGFEDDLVRR
ncbi:hypothetical protein B0T14DRAFT_563872 [Immersiella caudata]|uniref:Uncharacterized protein n=1 Tax=Immersiella caudata TaxID=314043 RepID=A0AA39WVM9_9PEZI|nr:hypothetical protein B0T14DRAFT_563872 [Immersiella caudata]